MTFLVGELPTLRQVCEKATDIDHRSPVSPKEPDLPLPLKWRTRQRLRIKAEDYLFGRRSEVNGILMARW